MMVGFIYDAASSASYGSFPTDELAQRLHDLYAFDDATTVSAHLYAFNFDGGPRVRGEYGE